jgi:hypothetical protein
MAETMKNVIFWGLKSQFVPHRRHITSPLQSPAGSRYVRFEVFKAATMKNTAFCDVTTCDVFRLLVTANGVPSTPILVSLMMEAIYSSQTLVPTRAMGRNISEDGILQHLL